MVGRAILSASRRAAVPPTPTQPRSRTMPGSASARRWARWAPHYLEVQEVAEVLDADVAEAVLAFSAVDCTTATDLHVTPATSRLMTIFLGIVLHRLLPEVSIRGPMLVGCMAMRLPYSRAAPLNVCASH